MRYESAGESHGRGLVAMVLDVPAGISLSAEHIDKDLRRRQMGYGRGGRMKIESDHAEIISGIRFEKTLGTPVALLIRNKDHENWLNRMSPDGKAPDDLVREHSPRPGHADLTGALKIGTNDCRDILERASARETACRVAAGAIAKAMLDELGVSIKSCVARIGTASLPDDYLEARDWQIDAEQTEHSETRCPDPNTTESMKTQIDTAKEKGQSLGGCFCVTASGLVPGLGGYATAADRLTSQLGGAIFSIPAIKAVEFGIGNRAGELFGSDVHDPISYDPDRGYFRESNRAGGLEGGMSTGELLILKACMKPIPTMTSPLLTVDMDTHDRAEASKERSDVCAVPAAAVVAEAEVAMVLANAYQDKFGRDCLSDMLVAIEHYLSRIK